MNKFAGFLPNSILGEIGILRLTRLCCVEEQENASISGNI